LLEKGQAIAQETRGWDEAKQKTFSQRGKEEAHDYRYMPDPDLPPITLSDEYIEKIKLEMPFLPSQWRELLAPLKLTRSQVDTLLEAEVDSPDIGYLSLIKDKLEDSEAVSGLVNMMINIEIPLRKEGNLPKQSDEQRAKLYDEVVKLLGANQLSSTAAKALLADLLASEVLPDDVAVLAKEKGYIQISDTAEINNFIKTIISDNPKAVEELKAGETKVLGFLVGQVMKSSNGKANPKLAEDLIKQAL
jgi:aspartyl-tRNA(Asn)/glutamyl-tRNA(Gln) amidotransferase subunit B